ncbi:opacity protein-like surface antigen [Rhodoligotrophos appendicifer]|uniref:outer membrane protein n=1 Tax=Rhodoligotrophos appendicifer TaxID=987056 RepID=UPI00117E03F9|nr:outer membrane beta-barrel protein [Rhodoligotrophos appendicifer]
MRNYLYAGVAATAMILGAQAASAADLYTPPPPEVVIAPAPVGGWYVGVFGGAAFPLSTKTKAGAAFYDSATDTFDAAGFNGKTEYDTGWLVGGNVGYEMGNGLRGEVELSYLQANNDRLKGNAFLDIDDSDFIIENNGGFKANAKDHTDVLFVLANMWYDFNMGMPFKPYLGGGVGVGFVNQHLKVGNDSLIDDSDTNFAFQAGAGFKWALSDAVDLDVGYRFKGVLDVKLEDKGGVGINGDAYAYKAQTKDDLYYHTVQAGISFKFGGY